MTDSPQKDQQVGTTAALPLTTIGLLIELKDLRDENRRLRRRVAALEAGRARWRDEARAWKWGALRWRPKGSV